MSGRPNTELIYGRNAAIEVMRGRRRVRQIYLVEGTERQARMSELLAEAQSRRVPIRRVPRADLDHRTGEANHQGVALEVSSYPYVSLDHLLAEAGGRAIVLLDHLQDTQNLGSLIRTAEASGSAGIIIPDRRAASITPAVVNASAGAVEHLPVTRVPNLARAIADCKEAGYWAVGLDADPPARNIFSASIPEPPLLVVGSEGKGIGPSLLKHCDVIVRLPMLGSIESLNASVAGSIALYELLRRGKFRTDAVGTGLVDPRQSN